MSRGVRTPTTLPRLVTVTRVNFRAANWSKVSRRLALNSVVVKDWTDDNWSLSSDRSYLNDHRWFRKGRRGRCRYPTLKYSRTRGITVSSGDRHQGDDAHLSPPDETQRLVERQGACVVGHHMQERRLAARLDAACHQPGQGGG